MERTGMSDMAGEAARQRSSAAGAAEIQFFESIDSQLSAINYSPSFITASGRKRFQLALRTNNACHYAEAFERVRGKTPDAKSSLARWYAIMRKSRFLNFAQLRETFPHADQVEKFTVFNIGGNKVRLIAAVHYNRNKIYIRHVLTHQEYDTGMWKK
jgi:mRNA interferase HigB